MHKGGLTPLADPVHPRYEKIKDLNSGTFGFVQLCKDKRTGEVLAIKFIERGEKVGVSGSGTPVLLLSLPNVPQGAL